MGGNGSTYVRWKGLGKIKPKIKFKLVNLNLVPFVGLEFHQKN